MNLKEEVFLLLTFHLDFTSKSEKCDMIFLDKTRSDVFLKGKSGMVPDSELLGFC